MFKIVISFIYIIIIANNTYANNYDTCYKDASLKYSIPEVVLRIISSVESNNNPYAINISGKGFQLKDKSSAEKMIQNNYNKNMDIGIMQINSWWFKRYGYERELGLDVCWNIHMGAYILGYEYDRHKDIWQAIAHYHSPSKKYQQRYVNKIYKEVVKWQRVNQ